MAEAENFYNIEGRKFDNSESSKPKSRPKGKDQVEKNGPHRIRDCLKKAALNAMKVHEEAEYDTKSLSAILGGVKIKDEKELSLKMEEDLGRIKTVNSESIPITGVAKGVELRLGEWTSKATIKVISLDDYDFVIGLSLLD
ncbi:hypothetical protein J1N35_014460 [Gossypium stocksii]|uniref:Uncharacterized protein n=1 Tax=Gossypium stocksii TaxID=47602 RepID=A0A9D3VWG0_9ROSI|nr:hypothetical protein J1N35_014460 [Gossypium stocksii]